MPIETDYIRNTVYELTNRKESMKKFVLRTIRFIQIEFGNLSLMWSISKQENIVIGYHSFKKMEESDDFTKASIRLYKRIIKKHGGKLPKNSP